MYDASRKMMFRFTEHPKTAVVTKQIPERAFLDRTDSEPMDFKRDERTEHYI